MKRSIVLDMRDALPKYYADSTIVSHLTMAEAAEMDTLHTHIQDVLRQYFVETATWGLAAWEQLCGIPVNEDKPYDQRRSFIKSKLRGAGTVTLQIIQSVVDSFQNGEVSVQENYSAYEVIVTFIGKRGIPPNLEDVYTALREIVPAHLYILFRFTYLRWNELDLANLTWDELEALDMTWDELEVWKP